MRRHVLNARAVLGWRLTEAVESLQRLAHRIDPETPHPEDCDRYFDAVLMAGLGEWESMSTLNPTFDMLHRAATTHGLRASDVIRLAEHRSTT